MSADPPAHPRALASPFLTRRRLLGAASGVLLVVGGGAVLALRTRGYDAGRERAALTAWQWTVLQQAARRITAPDESSGSRAPTADDVDVAGFADAWIGRMDPQVARDFGRFLAYLEHVAPLRCGLVSRFTRLGPAAQDQVLTAVQGSGSNLLRAGFEGLKSLVFMGYYRDPRTWSILGYDGPFVGRPTGGWK